MGGKVQSSKEKKLTRIYKDLYKIRKKLITEPAGLLSPLAIQQLDKWISRASDILSDNS